MGLTLNVIYEQVGQWSRENFGDQKGLGCIAPLMGLSEEFGELVEAINTSNAGDRKPAVIDAIGDMTIYMYDFCNRDGVTIEMVPDLVRTQQRFDLGSCNAADGLAIAIGNLHHAVLKRHQGIRGFDTPDIYEMSRNEWIGKFMGYMRRFASTRGLYEDMVQTTWRNVVSKRNWVAKPVEGV